jgi:hypothetical protein
MHGIFVVRNEGDYTIDNRFVWKEFLMVGIDDMSEDCFAHWYIFVDVNRVNANTWNINGILMLPTIILKQYVKIHCDKSKSHKN